MPQYTDTNVNQLVINKMTKAQYESITPSETELYLVPDEIDSTPTSGSDNPVTSGGVYTALQDKLDVPSTAGTSGQVLTSDGQGSQSWQTPTSAVSDVTVGGTSVVTNGVAVVPAIPDVSGKADKVVYVDASTPPSTMDANKVYQYGALSGNTTFPAFTAVSPSDTEVKIWCWTFTTPSTAPTITWPAEITSWNGGSAPTINAGMNYEVSVMGGVACIIETDIPT